VAIVQQSLEMLSRLGVALAIGLLIGFERGWQQRNLPEGVRVAGFRTFGLVGLLGAAAVILAGDQALVLAAIAFALGVIAGIGYFHVSRRQRGQSATGTVALLLTFALGAMAGRGYMEAASSAAVVVTLLLGVKPELHGLVRSIEREELLGTIRLLLISVVLLPILPNRGFGPWQALNPYRIWWMVVLVAGVSYLGYFAKRFWGRERGSLVTGVLGGIISSTAVTLSLSRRAGGSRADHDALAGGIVVACSIMFLRLLAVVGPIAPSLVGPLAAPLGIAAAVGFAGGAVLAYRSRDARGRRGGRDPELRNPLDLASGIKFGLILAVVMFASRALTESMGDDGLYVVAAVAGVADVDAIALSAAAMSTQGQAANVTAVTAVLLAAAVNTATKSAFAWAFGGSELGLRVTVPMASSLAASAAAFLATRTL
jgi:uncharacterized membrane protein (DUF4010 family)